MLFSCRYGLFKRSIDTRFFSTRESDSSRSANVMNYKSSSNIFHILFSYSRRMMHSNREKSATTEKTEDVQTQLLNLYESLSDNCRTFSQQIFSFNYFTSLLNHFDLFYYYINIIIPIFFRYI